ncbi:hypothetical protein [Flavobacterium soli]|uniref:hypothetical protein n=1 Tax=Flavobacterium soli TaxID=344881 RepID=UPI00041AEDDF|nr:hypothetical protein [Flavobacterium soli]
MDKNTVNIDHLYNPARFGVGQMYEDVFEGIELQNKFYDDQVVLSKYINTCKLEDAIFLVIKAYKDKYPTSYFAEVYENGHRDPLCPLRTDTKIEWVIDKETKDYDKVLFTFKEPQDMSLLTATVEEVLAKNSFYKQGNKYIVNNSPIESIEFSTKELAINLDIKKAIRY